MDKDILIYLKEQPSYQFSFVNWQKKVDESGKEVYTLRQSPA